MSLKRFQLLIYFICVESRTHSSQRKLVDLTKIKFIFFNLIVVQTFIFKVWDAVLQQFRYRIQRNLLKRFSKHIIHCFNLLSFCFDHLLLSEILTDLFRLFSFVESSFFSTTVFPFCSFFITGIPFAIINILTAELTSLKQDWFMLRYTRVEWLQMRIRIAQLLSESIKVVYQIQRKNCRE